MFWRGSKDRCGVSFRLRDSLAPMEVCSAGACGHSRVFSVGTHALGWFWRYQVKRSILDRARREYFCRMAAVVADCDDLVRIARAQGLKARVSRSSDQARCRPAVAAGDRARSRRRVLRDRAPDRERGAGRPRRAARRSAWTRWNSSSANGPARSRSSSSATGCPARQRGLGCCWFRARSSSGSRKFSPRCSSSRCSSASWRWCRRCSSRW